MSKTVTEPLVTAGHLRKPKPELRPSGIDLAIFDMPMVERSSAPFTLARVTVPVGGSTEEDQHEVREIWVVLEGRGDLVAAGQPTSIGPGDTLFFDSYETHRVVNVSDQALEILSIWWRP
jgi:mannose-6-phosphate isomerase-like protein (cupin superfamily)